METIWNKLNRSFSETAVSEVTSANLEPPEQGIESAGRQRPDGYYSRKRRELKGRTYGHAFDEQDKAYEDQLYAQAYFNGGLDGLSRRDRAIWEKRYAEEIAGLTYKDQDNFFKNQVFRNLFENSDNKEDQDAYARARTRGERDWLVAQKALNSDIDGVSDIREAGIYDQEVGIDPQEFFKTKLHGGTAREGAMKYLEKKGDKYQSDFIEQIYSSSRKNELLDWFDKFSEEVSPYYKRYKGTNKLDTTENARLVELASFFSNEKVGGTDFAIKALQNHYQNQVAYSQSFIEKAGNTITTAIDDAAGFFIRLGGMAGGFTAAIFGGGKEEDESYWENLINNTIDNKITRYGDAVATTQSWKSKEQAELKELGLTDNPILNTVEQQNSLFSWNTPFEVLGNYGFTFAGGLASRGLSSIIKYGAKGLSATAGGYKAMRTIARGKKVLNLMIPGAIGTVEGGMEAALAKEEALRGFQEDINSRYMALVEQDVADYVASNPQEVVAYLQSLGYSINDLPSGNIITKGSGDQAKYETTYSPEELQQIQELILSDQELVNGFMHKYSQDIAEEMEAAEDKANSAMYWNFALNSSINGLIASTWKSTLQSSDVQRYLRTRGIGKGKTPYKDDVSITGTAGSYKANPKKATRIEAFKSRAKESFGEMLEEGAQSVSSDFSIAYSEDRMQQYLDMRYGNHPGAVATEYDVWKSFGAALEAAGDSIVSEETIKSGIYGGLSTFLGGIDFRPVSKKGKTPDESKLAYWARKSPVTWRSALTPLFSSGIAKEMNEHRQEVADYLNEFFSNKEVQDAIFNVEGTVAWMTEMNRHKENGDEKGVRDSRLGVMFGNIITLNSLEGTGYHTAAVASLRKRANLNMDNLQDPNSEESKAVQAYQQSVQNRGQNITAEEAAMQIKKSATEMLDMMEQVRKETTSIEKVFGQDIDTDVKASMIFNKLSIQDYKKRSEQLDGEISKVSTELSKTIPSEKSTLGRAAKSLVARHSSVKNAEAELHNIQEAKKKAKEALSKAKEKKPSSPREMRKLAYSIRVLESQVKSLKSQEKELAHLIKAYNKDVKPTEGKDSTVEGYVNTPILSAEEIIALPAIDRAAILSRKNRSNYSQEQQAEIDKVINIGTSVYQDFYSKIIDRGRIEEDLQNALSTQSEIMFNPDKLNIYASIVKADTKKRLFKEKNSNLITSEDLDDYTTFATSLNEVYARGDKLEIEAVNEMLQGRAFFERYKNESVQKNAIFHYAKNSLSEGDGTSAMDTFAATLDYLYSQEVDPMDDDEASNALTQLDDEGNSYFGNYLKRITEQASEDAKPTFTTVEEAIQTFKNVMAAFKNHITEVERNSREVTPTETTPEQAAPPRTPEEEVKLIPDRDQPSSEEVVTPEGKLISPEMTLIPEDTPKEEEIPQSDSKDDFNDTILRMFQQKNSKAIVDSVKTLLEFIDKNPRFSQDEKTKAKDIIANLSNTEFAKVEDLLSSIVEKAESSEEKVGLILKQAKAQLQNNIIKSETSRQSNTSKFTKQREEKLGKELAYSGALYPHASTNSSIIEGLNISWIRNNHPDSPIVKYWDDHHIQEYLSNDEVSKRIRRTEILFITDDVLTDAVQRNMGDKYKESRDIPIIAVVEDSNGRIEIDGKHYQPISIMPSTGAKRAGSERLDPIRRLALRNNGTQLIKNLDGSPVKTSVYAINASSVDTNYKGPNKNVLDISSADSSTSKAQRRETLEYQTAKINFISKLSVKKMDGYRQPVYKQSKRKGEWEGNEGGDTKDIFVFIAELDRSVARDSNMTLKEAIDSEDIDTLVNFNSRTQGAFKAIYNIIRSIPRSMYHAVDENGTISPDGEEAIGKLRKIRDRIEDNVGKFINVGGWQYQISIIGKDANGTLQYSIDLIASYKTDKIHIANVYGGMTEGEEIKRASYEFLKNLFVDESGAFRPGDFRQKTLARWQVDYPADKLEEGGEIRINESGASVKESFFSAYDDGILEISGTELNYRIHGVTINSPFALEADKAPRHTTVANPENAQAASPSKHPKIIANDQVESLGAAIDGESGAVLEGTPKPIAGQALEKAERIVKTIVSDSKDIQLEEDESFYIDKKTGQRYARVTSLIAADEEAEERFDSHSPWALPSTAIGTGIDEFIRDFFDGKINTERDFTVDGKKLSEVYPNANEEDLRQLAKDLVILQNTFIANGLTIVPRGVTITGNVEVIDNAGNAHNVDVAGTLDLLAYDTEGNFLIFDMKTHRSEIDQRKEKKYTRQLSLYKKILEDKYDVNVKSLQIIPIRVSYPAPVGTNRGIASYSKSSKKPNQLLVNGEEFTGAHPTLENPIPVKYREQKIIWEKMTSKERELVPDIKETQTDSSKVDLYSVLDTETEPTEDPWEGWHLDDIGDGDHTFSWGRTDPVPTKYLWENLPKDVRDKLEKEPHNLSKESWEILFDEEMEQHLGCIDQY